MIKLELVLATLSALFGLAIPSQSQPVAAPGSASRNIRLRNNDPEEARRPSECENGALREAVVIGTSARR
jgi:hypothetical protein